MKRKGRPLNELSRVMKQGQPWSIFAIQPQETLGKNVCWTIDRPLKSKSVMHQFQKTNLETVPVRYTYVYIPHRSNPTASCSNPSFKRRDAERSVKEGKTEKPCFFLVNIELKTHI